MTDDDSRGFAGRRRQGAVLEPWGGSNPWHDWMREAKQDAGFRLSPHFADYYRASICREIAKWLRDMYQVGDVRRVLCHDLADEIERRGRAK